MEIDRVAPSIGALNSKVIIIRSSRHDGKRLRIWCETVNVKVKTTMATHLCCCSEDHIKDAWFTRKTPQIWRKTRLCPTNARKLLSRRQDVWNSSLVLWSDSAESNDPFLSLGIPQPEINEVLLVQAPRRITVRLLAWRGKLSLWLFALWRHASLCIIVNKVTLRRNALWSNDRAVLLGFRVSLITWSEDSCVCLFAHLPCLWIVW